MAMFKAFKPSGMEKIARSMGYQGNMQGFQDYLGANPAQQQQMDLYTNKAMQMAKGGMARKNYAFGGFSNSPVIKAASKAATQAAKLQTTQTAPPDLEATLPVMPYPTIPEQPQQQPEQPQQQPEQPQQPQQPQPVSTGYTGITGTPIATPPAPSAVDPLAQYRQNVEMYSETGEYKNPQIKSSHEAMLKELEKKPTSGVGVLTLKTAKNNAVLDYLRNIYTGPIYQSETGKVGLGGGQFTPEFTQFANTMGLEIDNSFAATDGPQMVNIPEGNPTLTQAGWMPQAPATQPGITDFTVQQMYAPGVPVGGETIATGIGYDASQDIAAGTGALTGTVATPTAMALTAQAGQPEQTKANVMQAAQAAPGVDSAMNATQAAQANPQDPRAQIAAAQQTTSSVGNLAAAQGNASLINNPVQRQIQSGELISGVADAQTAAQFTEQIQAATATPSQQATVQGQLNNLMQQFQGGNTPTWAASAMRSVTSAMAARGLSASSLSGQAMVQAAMESALPIAQADAQVQAQFEGQNLSNRQQRAMLAAQQRAQFMGQEFDQAFQSRVQNSARIGDIANMNFTAEQQVQLENSRAVNTMNLNNLSNRQAMVMAEASALAQLDTANLSNRQQSAVQNAQNFLQVNMANLSNRQQTELFKAQQRVQSLFTDQAATNAAAQFNASSQNQVDQFFANLGAQVSQFNATQQNAQSQFNAGQTNTVARFNAELNNQRDQFNAQNQLVIAQANAQWRRQIATADTAALNRANELNANAILDISKNAYDNLWNYYADTMEWAYLSANQELDRMNNLAIAELSASAQADANAAARSSSSGSALGSLIGTLGAAAITKWCWVAREVYGPQDYSWIVFRNWMFNKAPKWLYNLYGKYGEAFAEYISNKPLLKKAIKCIMDKVIQNHKMEYKRASN